MAPTAAIADVEVNKKTGKITVKHVYHALSAGLAVYPDGIENQIVGGTVQAVSWTLAEQVAFSKTHVASSDFVTYPLLRFKDAPEGHADRDPVGHLHGYPLHRRRRRITA